MGNNSETPKRRKRRRMITGLAAAGAAAAAIGGYVASHIGNESAVPDKEHSTDAPLEVLKADRGPVQDQQSQTRAHVLKIATDATEEADEPDSGPTDAEASEALLQDTLRHIRERVENYDEALWRDYKEELERCFDDSGRDKTRLIRLSELMGKKHVVHVEEMSIYERGGIISRILVVSYGSHDEFLHIVAEPVHGTVNVVFHKPNLVTVNSIEPWRAPDLINDYNRARVDYLRSEDSVRNVENFTTATRAIFEKYGWTPPSQE